MRVRDGDEEVRLHWCVKREVRKPVITFIVTVWRASLPMLTMTAQIHYRLGALTHLGPNGNTAEPTSTGRAYSQV